METKTYSYSEMSQAVITFIDDFFIRSVNEGIEIPSETLNLMQQDLIKFYKDMSKYKGKSFSDMQWFMIMIKHLKDNFGKWNKFIEIREKTYRDFFFKYIHRSDIDYLEAIIKELEED